MSAGTIGRPTMFNDKIAASILERLADGESLRAICDGEDMPSRVTVWRWLNSNSDFSSQYARAREEQADSIFDEILTIADDGRNDWMARNAGDGEGLSWVENGEALRRSALRIDARKWMAGKLRSKYSDKQTVQHTGKDDGPIRTETTIVTGVERAGDT